MCVSLVVERGRREGFTGLIDFRGIERRSRLTITVLVLIGLSAPAWADVRFTISAGAGRYVRTGTMVPVLLRIENTDDTDYEGYATVQFAMGMRRSPTGVREIPLASGAVKQALFYVHAPSPCESITVTYVERGRTIARQTEQVTTIPSLRWTFGAIGQFPRSLPANEQPTNQRDIYTKLFITPEQIPDRHEGLEMYDVIFVTPPLEMPLASAQVRALKAWAMRGGVVIFETTRRTDAYIRGALAEWLPFHVVDSAGVTYEEFGENVLTGVGEIRYGEAIYESAGYPLVVKAPYGLGAVYCFNVSPDSPGFIQWEGAPALWRDILGPQLTPRTDDEYQESYMPLSGMYYGPGGEELNYVSEGLASSVYQRPTTEFRLWLVLILTVVYALVAGPGDYFLVRFLGKPILTWITFPVIVAVFTLAAYLGAKALVGGETSLKSNHRILVFQDQSTAIRDEVASYFVSETGTYRFSANSGAPLHLLEAGAVDDVRFAMEEEGMAVLQPIPLWSHRIYGFSEEAADYPDVRVTMTRDSGELAAKIVNESGQTLRSQRVYYGDGVWGVDEDLGPGETATITLTPFNRRTASEAYALSPFEGSLANYDWDLPMTRSLNYDRALRNGAAIYSARAGVGPSALLVDGAPRHEESGSHLLVLTYEVPAE